MTRDEPVMEVSRRDHNGSADGPVTESTNKTPSKAQMDTTATKGTPYKSMSMSLSPSMSPSPTQPQWRWKISFLAAYLLFGLLHELSHVVSAAVSFLSARQQQQHQQQEEATLLCYLSSLTEAIWTLLLMDSTSPSGAFSTASPTATTTTTATIFSSILPTFQVILSMTFGRAVRLPFVPQINGAGLSNENDDEEHQLALIRHAGWISSSLLAILVYSWFYVVYNYVSKTSYRNKKIHMNPIVQAAFITALEAICTDGLGFGGATTTSASTTSTSSASARMVTFFCGNFGVILLHSHTWTSTPGDYGKTALDLLEKMVQITMMRGAQTGGVVTWVTNGKRGRTNNQSTPDVDISTASTAARKNSGTSQLVGPAPTAIRCRVVNGKRTDLSEQLRKDLNSKICSSFSKRINPSIRCLMGHTRFATSSKATLDGTHPHQWSPPESRRLYPLGDSRFWDSTAPRPFYMTVSNFITHNGDLDFFKQETNGQLADLEMIQTFLVKATKHPMPATVDSAAIAGLIDLIRSAGCFALSIRFAYLLGMKEHSVPFNTEEALPRYRDYEKLGRIFEKTLREYCTMSDKTLVDISGDKGLRMTLTQLIVKRIRSDYNLSISPFTKFAYHDDNDDTDKLLEGVEDFADEQPSFDNDGGVQIEIDLEKSNIGQNSPLRIFVQTSVNAFFDNDLFFSTKYFMKNAVGSFGLMVTSSMDAHRQICIAARGQPMSLAFYPDKGVICYGSELAAVKAGLNFENPAGKIHMTEPPNSTTSAADFNMAKETCRFDLDDLGGEVVLVDFSTTVPSITTHQESKSTSRTVRKRVTPLLQNEFLLPLTPDADDPIDDDIKSIPRALSNIQENWKEGGLNRTTAWYLGRKIRERLRSRIAGKIRDGSLDILVTGCEVSLWLAEQFASDLRKSLPKLRISSTSSNKLLGVFGQELVVPAIGFPMSEKIPDLKNTIIIIVSHSGGTFGPLAVSNLLQSVTKHIFVVSSEWDTQIGKQLRGMFTSDKDTFASRVFTTDIGVRPAEPCSLSVAATHQLLTQIYEYICLTILQDHAFRDFTGAVVTDQDLRVLEKCNQQSILSLEAIVGLNAAGNSRKAAVRGELKEAGKLWADHVLENARAYIMSFIYVVGTVTTGYPLITGIATAAGLDINYILYITRFLDSLIYFFLPQINITILRLIQGRNVLHRMTGRTVVIGDIPWVAQSAEAFLSKIFARSYSIAGLNVLSGNPADHLVHRHTHRVTRGSLLVCGRPDGRLTALTSAECAVSLSVNQASSIQSLGGTCESITIGHNPSKMGLTKMDIALNTYRPKFLCEQILGIMDDETNRKQHALESKLRAGTDNPKAVVDEQGFLAKLFCWRTTDDDDDESDAVSVGSMRSSHSLKGAYLGLKQSMHGEMSQKKMVEKMTANGKDVTTTGSTEMFAVRQQIEVESRESMILAEMINEKKKSNDLQTVFKAMDVDGSGTIDMEEFVTAYSKIDQTLTRKDIETLFCEADVDDSGCLSFEEFESAMNLSGADMIRKLQHANHRDEKGMLNVRPSEEEYFGAELQASTPAGIPAFAQAQSQHFSMELYESRIASLQRFVALCVMFHEMGKRVQDFFPKYSLGVFGYKMERTHSIMRIATTASPVSGDAVRDQMEHLRMKARFQNAIQLILNAWYRKQQARIDDFKAKMNSSKKLQVDDGSSSPTLKDDDEKKDR